MKRLEKLLKATMGYQEDVKTLKSQIPELKDMPDKLVDIFYSDFSDMEYYAGWINLNKEHINHFRKWLLEEVL